MASTDPWRDLKRALHQRYELLRDRPTWLGMLWPGVVPVPLRVELAAFEDEPCALIVADIGPADRLPLDEAMALNLALPIGSYALEGARIVLRHVVALRPDCGPLVALLIDRLGAEASRTRARVAPPPPTADDLLLWFPAD